MIIQDIKKYPNNTDSWIVISPGRTGSRLICASLQNIYSNNLNFHHAGINNHLPMKYLDLLLLEHYKLENISPYLVSL